MADTSVGDLEFVDGVNNPQLAAQVAAAALAEPEQPLPVIDAPDSTSFTRLPAGLLVDGKNAREFEVQELTGLHEERLSRVDRESEPARWMQTLLECGVVSIGGQEATGDLLRELLIGDRDYLAMAVRNATYGPEIDLGTQACPGCGEPVELVVDIREVPIREFDGERTFDVALSKGGSVKVALPDGNAQLALFEDGSLTEAERKSILLAECVQFIEHKNGAVEAVAGFPSLIKNLSIVDRNRIVQELAKRQPGPRYDELKREHTCGYEAGIGVGLMHLFPGM